MRKLSFIPFIALLLFSIGCNQDPVVVESVEDFETYVSDEMKSQKIATLATLIFEGDDVLYEGYMGKPDVDAAASLESNHLFMLASISKTVTATALLQLYDQGLFGLDDNINDHLSFNVNVPGYTTPITFRMLLTHTSGIADGSALDDQYHYGVDSPTDLGYFIENYLVPGGEFYDENENYYDFDPGTQHEYSNVGNALIGVLVEQISGMGFNAYCKLNIFTPLGMTNTYWRLDEISQTIVMPYDYVAGGYDAIGHYTFTDYPNGGLRSTVQDMHKFLRAFALNGVSNGYQLLESETATAVITPQIPSLDATTGLHMFQMNTPNNLWGHDGGEQGVATIMAFNPTTKIGVIIFTNQGEANLDEMLAVAYDLGGKL